MGGNNSSNANNLPFDGLLNPLDLRERNNTSPYDTEETNQNNVQMLLEHQKSKVTKTYKNPILLLKSSLKLEKDSMNPNIYYYTFKYTSLLNFEAHFHLNSTFSGINLVCNPNFPSIIIKNLNRANEDNFIMKEAFFDMTKYYSNKNLIISEKSYYDLIIELKAFKDTGEEECSYITFCNFIPFKLDENSESFSVKIRCEVQKLKIRNYLFEVYSIFGLDPSIDSSSNDCEACCTKKKNTIFLPCKHSYACSGCSVVVRLPNNQCPLCRQSVADCLIIE